jgi:hypothetical protein
MFYSTKSDNMEPITVFLLQNGKMVPGIYAMLISFLNTNPEYKVVAKLRIRRILKDGGKKFPSGGVVSKLTSDGDGEYIVRPYSHIKN